MKRYDPPNPRGELRIDPSFSPTNLDGLPVESWSVDRQALDGDRSVIETYRGKPWSSWALVPVDPEERIHQLIRLGADERRMTKMLEDGIPESMLREIAAQTGLSDLAFINSVARATVYALRSLIHEQRIALESADG